MVYKFTAKWQKGSQHKAANTLSRSPLSLPNNNDELAEQEIEVANGQDRVHPAMSHAQLRASSLQEPDKENLHLQELRQHAEKDLEYLALKKTILHGFPSTKAQCP